MTKTRLSMLVLLLFGSVMAIGRVGLEAGMWLLEERATFVQWFGLGALLVGMFVLFASLAGDAVFGRRAQRARQHGGSTMLVMATVAIAGVTLLACSSCATLKQQGRDVAGDVVDCMKPELLDAARELGSVLDTALVTVLSDSGKVDREGFKAIARDLTSDAAGCALAAAIERLKKPRDQGPPFASPLTVDVADLEAGWSDIRREQFGGRSFAVAR